MTSKDQSEIEKFLKKQQILKQVPHTSLASSFFSVVRIIPVSFIFPDGFIITLKCVGNHSVGQIKHCLLVRLYKCYIIILH